MPRRSRHATPPSPSRVGHRHRLSLGTAVMLVLSLQFALSGDRGGSAPAEPEVTSPVAAIPLAKASQPFRAPEHRLPAATWPAAGSAVVDLGATTKRVTGRRPADLARARRPSRRRRGGALVDYASFGAGFGGGSGDRLRIIRYPACALTAPSLPGCLNGTVVGSRNDAAANLISAELAVESGGSVFAVAAAPTSGSGSCSAQRAIR
jgi:hypothetical protein